MSDPFDDGDGNKVIAQLRNQIKDLTKEIGELKPFQERATKAERQLAFVEAGVDLSDAKTKYFVKGYDGDLTAEAIKKAATEAGFLEEKKTEEPQGQQTQETPGTPPVGTPQSAEQLIAAQGFQAIADATHQGAPPQVNLLQGLEKAAREGGPDGVAKYLRGIDPTLVVPEQ